MSCVIGIFPNERHRKQPVTIDLCLYLNTRKAARSTNIHDTIDYAAAVKEVAFILEQCEFLLIETAVEAVCNYFLTTYTADHLLPQVDAVMVRISKPSALTHGIVPSIQILRHRKDMPATSSNRISVHQSEQGSLTLASVPANTDVHIAATGGDGKSCLIIGRWTSSDAVVKSRSVFQSDENGPHVLRHQQPQPQLVLLSH